jgi:hypothetical protein
VLGNCSANQSRAAGLQLGEEFRQGRLPQTLGGLYALQQSALHPVAQIPATARNLNFFSCFSLLAKVGDYVAGTLQRITSYKQERLAHLNTRARVQVGAQDDAD